MYNPLFPFLCSVFGIDKISETTSFKNFYEIKYFHPEGKRMKDDIYVYRGFFLGECIKNSRSFYLSPYFKVNLNKKGRCKGGVILFPEDMDISVNEITRIVNSCISKIKNLKIENPDLKFEVNENFFGNLFLHPVSNLETCP